MNFNQATLLAFLVGVIGVASAAAWSGPLTSPSFTAPRDCPPAVMQQVSAALNRRDATFLGGQFFGAFSHSMRYGGDSKALNGMLADLAACPGMILSIAFSTNFHQPADWTVADSHGGTNFIFRVQVNVKSTRLRLEELVIPAVQGPPLAAAPGHIGNRDPRRAPARRWSGGRRHQQPGGQVRVPRHGQRWQAHAG